MGTRGSSRRNYRQNGGHVAPPQARGGSETWIIPGRAVWWSLNEINTARWRRDRDEGKGGDTGRVGREVTGLTKWKELRLAVGHSSVEARTSVLLNRNIKTLKLKMISSKKFPLMSNPQKLCVEKLAQLK